MPVPPEVSRPSLHAESRSEEPRISKRRSVQAPNRTEYIFRMLEGDPIVHVVPVEHVATFEAVAGLILAALDEHAGAEHPPEIRLHA